MAQLFTQEIFELKPLIKSIDIKLCAQNRNGVKQILALITEENDIVIYYCYGELPAIIKRIPWITDSGKSIQAACFDPTATWLLVVCLDSSLYIVPALYIVDKKQKIDCKWSLTDITAFPKCSQIPNLLPTCCVWWQTLECNQNALIGFQTGKILLVSLTDGRVLGECNIPEAIRGLNVCIDNVKESVSLLINSDSERQWRLILEQHSSGYTWPSESSNSHTEDTVKSRFFSLKQIGVDKLASLKQRLGSRKDSQSDSASETTHAELILSASSLSDNSETYLPCPSNVDLDFNISYNNHNNINSAEPELMSQFVNTFFTPQSCRNRHFFSALYRPTGLLTVHAADFETAPIFVYRILPRTHSLVLTDNLIITLNRDINVISIISCQLAECILEGETEFNDDSLVAQFMIDNEEIVDFFKVIDMSPDITTTKNNIKNKLSNTKNKNEMSFLRPAIDTCIVVTTKTVYKIFVRHQPVQKFIEYVTEENNLEKAEKLSYIFNLNLQQLLEYCGDLMISRGSYHSGIILYKRARVHLLKRVLKLAVSADCKTLLKFVHLCLSASRIDMNITTRIHIGNVAVMAYIELLLRSHSSEQVKSNNTKDFMNFLVHESHFDPILAVNMACQAGHWNVVNLLSKSRGLQPETVVAFGKVLQNDLYFKPTSLDFLYALSEPTLTQSLLILPHSSQIIFQYIRENVDSFSSDILRRLSLQLDPSQPCAIPFLKAIYQNNKDNSTTDTNMESFDYEGADSCSIVMKDLIETFLFVILSLTARFSSISFDLSLLDIVLPQIIPDENHVINRLPDLKLLSCGYEHAAVIRNNCVFTMGVATSGCLGTGPVLTNTSGPRLVNTLQNLKVTPLSVSCGKKHTLCATDCGVFAWGSNSHGQLGLGPHLQETPYPQLITTISHLKIVDISAGQYHSIALTHTGKVYTWGWGIHGQLGHGCSDNEYYPKLVNFDQPVRQVAAGHAHSLILTCDGKVYGFGSNVFAQLENNTNVDIKKCTRPTWIIILPDIYVPVEKITSSYFHNMAVTADQKVYMWGASPEEVRCFQQRLNQKQNNGQVSSESWKASIQMYQSQSRRPIRQISVGYRHCAILDQGRILWGKNKEEELCHPNLRDPYEGIMGHRFSHVACGLDYTMAIDQNGQVLAWGTPAMIETILGVSMDLIRKKQDERTIIFKGTRRSLKSQNVHPISNNLPIEISVLPSMAFTFNQTNHKILLKNKYVPNEVLLVEDNDPQKFYREEKLSRSKEFHHIYNVPNIKVGQRTIHFALQSFLELYDVENILKKSSDLNNYQVASKVSFLHGHFVDSLGFSIQAFKRHIGKLGIDLPSLFTCKDSYDVKEKDQGVDLIIKTIEKEKSSSCSSPARILSSSSSLDSLRQFGEEGGQESPCEFDMRQNITNFVQSVRKGEAVLPKLNENQKDLVVAKNCLQIKNKQAKEVLDLASQTVEFYIKKIYISENHILMQNILLKCIEFWLSHNLPVAVLENILLKNLDKYFYPLSILLFCKNFGDEEVILEKEQDVVQLSSSGFLKEFSTKFCLHLCSMVLENANKS
ncbi:uncharacterized protein LOC126741961 [Anthonomus grandis grandis]|uniref:uncharacterized protein LOC126741961 n=1 Tax=Anthonomus grandis grandis TaxID=2921223 RepID=UPI0021669348|nr:uncharacterized protein LOC126741961 [Anthonomus grandis grandis]